MSERLSPPYRIGLDIGGTFTDLVLAGSDGAVMAFKAPSTPADPAQGVLQAIAGAARAMSIDANALLADVGLLVHGSTIATNTLLEGKGARVGLITTEGFRDVLEIRRGLRRDVWDHRAPFPAPLVPRRLRLGVTERIGADGSIVTPLDAGSVRAALRVFRQAEVDAVAVCLINSYRNPAHEQAVRDITAREWPGIEVSCSCEIAPVMGEYERTATVVANAYVGRRTVPYLRALAQRLSAMSLRAPLLVVQSNGGALDVEGASRQPVQMVLSGPASGVGAMRWFAGDTGSRDLIAIEVGGTSCDVTLMRDGQVQMTEQLDVEGHCVAIPSVEIHTVGAGGGTIGHRDAAGLLHAGPQGAGARPGPAAYGLGGTQPTITDAQLVLGRLAPGPYAGGAIHLDLDRAARAIDDHLARPMGLSLAQAAAGLIRLVEQNIQHAVERVSIERGYDPRVFTLVAAGGAGPLHGAPVGRALGCAAVYVPRLAGVFCAFGMANTDVRIDRVGACYRRLADLSDGALTDALSALVAQTGDDLRRQGFAEGDRRFECAVAMRYVGQQWPVVVPCERAVERGSLRAGFERAHQRLYGHHQPGGEIEVLTLKVAGTGRLGASPAHAGPVVARAAGPAAAHRPVWIDEVHGVRDTAIHRGASLVPGHWLDGPALVDEQTTTILVEPGQRLSVTAAGNYLIRPHRAETVA